jgi:hypothetical protein
MKGLKWCRLFYRSRSDELVGMLVL